MTLGTHESPRSSLQAALVEQFPERVTLARQITMLDDVAAMSDADLDRMLALHDTEIVRLRGKIEAAEQRGADLDVVRHGASLRALRVLNLHRGWLQQEQAKRRRAANVAAQQAAHRQAEALRERKRQEVREAARLAAEAKRRRQREADAESRRYIEVFKAVCREALGAEMYDHLVQATLHRMKGEA